MSTRSNCCGTEVPVGVFIVGGLLAVGVAAAAWVLFAPKAAAINDPMEETERRINDLERSLHRLQETFTQTVDS